MPENVIKEKLAAEEVASKERVNLSRCNLGILDETEAEDVNGKKSPLAADLDDVFKVSSRKYLTSPRKILGRK